MAAEGLREAPALVMIDGQGTITFWNDVATAHFGHERDDALGRDVDMLVPDDLRAAHHQGLARAMGGGERHLEGAATHLPVRHADGSVVTHPARFHHISNPDGTLTAALASFGPAAPGVDPWTPIPDLAT